MRKGFTLIELLVVVAIIGLLMAMVMPGLSHGKRVVHHTAEQVEMLRLMDAGLASGILDARDYQRIRGMIEENAGPALINTSWQDGAEWHVDEASRLMLRILRMSWIWPYETNIIDRGVWLRNRVGAYAIVLGLRATGRPDNPAPVHQQLVNPLWIQQHCFGDAMADLQVIWMWGGIAALQDEWLLAVDLYSRTALARNPWLDEHRR